MQVARRFLCTVVEMNLRDFSVAGFRAMRWAGQRVIANAVMATRKGLRKAKVARMTLALWECDD